MLSLIGIFMKIFQLTIVCMIRAETATLISHNATVTSGSDMTYIKAPMRNGGMFSRSFKWARRTRSTSSSFLISMPGLASSGFSTWILTSFQITEIVCDLISTYSSLSCSLENGQKRHENHFDDQNSTPSYISTKSFIIVVQSIKDRHFRNLKWFF